MSKIFVEENGVYGIDCTDAVWASDQMHGDYYEAGLHINDVDFVIENSTEILLVEYKNANISGAVNPGAFNPMEDKKVSVAIRKFYDSLHYLRLLDKTKPVSYVYILEFPNGDVTMRKRLRNRLKLGVPFALQEKIGNGRKLIEKLDVVSIEEWNKDKDYGKYPIAPVEQGIVK